LRTATISTSRGTESSQPVIIAHVSRWIHPLRHQRTACCEVAGTGVPFAASALAPRQTSDGVSGFNLFAASRRSVVVRFFIALFCFLPATLMWSCRGPTTLAARGPVARRCYTDWVVRCSTVSLHDSAFGCWSFTCS
jgi:hypothetical protein